MVSSRATAKTPPALLFAVLGLAALCPRAHSQTPPPAPARVVESGSNPGTGSGPWSDGPRRATLSLGLVSKDAAGRDRFTPGGAAVLIKDAANRLFLATALHVLDNPAEHYVPETIQVRGWKDEQKSRYEDLGTTLQLWKNGRALFTSSAKFDLAVIPVPQDLLQRVADDKHIVTVYGPEWIAGADETYEGADLFILAEQSFAAPQPTQRALMRSGIIAWADSAHPVDHEFFIDAHIVAGNSGAPVFSSASGMTRTAGIESGRSVKLLGIISQTTTSQPELSLGAHLPREAATPAPANIEVVEPAHALLELMAYAH